jgi:5,10-methylenetetrahydrofolate reductase
VTKVTDALTQTDLPVFICDFTPPRGADPALLDEAQQLEKGDFISVAYNPGKLVRVDSVAAAHQIRRRFGKEVVFNLSPRDMNKIAIQSRLLGAAAMGLDNVLVLQGDPIAERDAVTEVADYKATSLLSSIRDLNAGLDYRGSKLRSACDFCIGATLDPSREIDRQVSLAARKIEAGAHFFVTQPVFDMAPVDAIYRAYRARAGHDMSLPVFWGIQLLAKDGVLFSRVPAAVLAQLEKGRDGAEIATEAFDALHGHGENFFYVVAPILKGGARDYAAAARFLSVVR